MDGRSDAPLVIVSNRGPVDFVWLDGRWQARPAAGGLSSMLTPLARDVDLLWVCAVSEPPAARGDRAGLAAAARTAAGRVRVVPVPLPSTIYDRYYNEISNEVLWMLQHLIVGPGGLASIDRAQRDAWDAGYLEANRLIAEAVVAVGASARAILVQDYHLYPLPALLRRRCPGVPLGHFTHIPFAGPAVWRLLPAAWRTTLLAGILGADVVGVQTGRDVHAALAAFRELLGLPVELAEAEAHPAGPATGAGHGAVEGHGTVEGYVTVDSGRRVLVRAYPASVDLASLQVEMRSHAVQAARERLLEHAGRRIVVRADRLDPAKNQVAGFRAFGRLLECRPDLRSRLRFLAFLAPSRAGLPAYQACRSAVLSVVEEINARFMADCGGPAIVLHLEHDPALVLAALERADVLLVNSVGDGMNLVVKEWATVTRHDGVAVVSETAGVASEAADVLLLISPLDIEGTAQALADALDMPRPARAERLARLRHRLASWTSRDWLVAQLDDLARCGSLGTPLDAVARV